MTPASLREAAARSLPPEPVGATASLEAELSDLFANALRVEVPSPDTDLVATARLDSVGMVELLLQIEKRFGVRVEMQDLEIDHFRSLAAIAAFVAARRRDRPA